MLLPSCLAICAGNLQSQGSYNFNNPAMRAIADDESTLGWVLMREDLTCCTEVESFWAQHGAAFGLNSDDEMLLTDCCGDTLNDPMRHYKYQHVYKGLEVEQAVSRLHSVNGQVRKATGRIVPDLDLEVAPSLTLAQARAAALNSVNASIFMWQDTAEENLLKTILQNPAATYFPEGKLLLTTDTDTAELEAGNFVLAYFFEVYTKEPLGGDAVYVDANSGVVFKKIPLVSNCVGTTTTSHTLYDGNNRQYFTEYTGVANGYRLFDDCRGSGVHTQFNSAEVYDADNDWTTAATVPSASAHWATEWTYDYLLQQHNRNSYNNAGTLMYSNVSSAGCDNAFWFGTYALFYKGCSLASNYLVSLDVVGHEFGHGICKSSAGFFNAGEAGALNESFSDIFGAMVEFYAGASTGNIGDYLIGEDFWVANGYLRDMKNPKSKSNPDTYLGQFWGSSNSHNRCTVHNHWFYLLAEGSSLTDGNNDKNGGTNNWVYTPVTGIGKNKAAAIAYRSLTVYLTPGSGYAAARQGAIEAAKDLFGNCSFEVVQTALAWDAVGVYAPATIAVNLDACDDFYNSTAPNIFIASNTIRAGNICNSGYTTVHNDGTLVMKAGQSVELRPGFWAKPGSYSHAYIMTCASGNYLAPPSDETASRSAIKDEPVAQAERSSELFIQPNPNSGDVKVSLPGNYVYDNSFLRLSNVAGQVLLTLPFEATEMQLDLHQFPAGLYFLSHCDGKGIMISRPVKIVKQ